MNGVLVTLLVNKLHPDGDGELSAGVSGLVVQANPNADRSIRYVVDFGAEGQWNCEESELSQEGRAAPAEPARARRYGVEVPLPPTREEEDEIEPKALKQEDVKVLSFEEEMAILEGK